MKSTPCAILLVFVFGGPAAAVSTAAQDPTREQMLNQLSANMRGIIEPTFRESTGFGFESFVCEVHTDLGPGVRFDCTAVDEENDRIRYTLEVDDEGMATVVSASQPAEALSDADRALLEPPCRRFLEFYAASDWDTLVADLQPAVLESSPPDEIRAQLIPVREALGDLRAVEALTYSRTDAVFHEMEFALDCENGPGFARFRVAIEGDEAVVSAFVVSPSPGSPLHARMLLIEGRDTIAGVLGVEVAEFDAPVRKLHHVGDAVEGTATLADGRVFAIGVFQQGRADDFDVIDYRFYVLDVPFLLVRAFAKNPDPATSVNCPTPIAPDGGTLTCTVEFESGKQSAVTVARRTGDHRIVDTKPM